MNGGVGREPVVIAIMSTERDGGSVKAAVYGHGSDGNEAQRGKRPIKYRWLGH